MTQTISTGSSSTRNLIDPQALPPLPKPETSGAGSLEKHSPRSASDLDSFADFHEQYVSKYIELADLKAGAAFTVVSGVFAYLATWKDFQEWILDPSFTAKSIASIIALVALSVSAALTFIAVVPRLTTSGEGIIFWGAVAKMTNPQEYFERLTKLDKPELIRNRIHHLYDLSCVCSKKYRLISRGMWSGALGLLLVLLLKAFE